MYPFLQSNRGAAALEYSLFISFIALLIAGVLQVLGPNLIQTLSTISGGLTPVQIIEDNPNSNELQGLKKYF